VTIIRKIAILAATLVAVGSAAAGLPPQEQTGSVRAGWWNPAYQYRLRVTARIPGTDRSRADEWSAFNKFESSPLTACAEIHRKKAEEPASQKDVRVIDASGKPIPCKVYFMGKPETLMVLFPIPRTGGVFDIYYGSNQPEDSAAVRTASGRSEEWLPPTNSLTVTTLNIAAQIFPLTLPQLKATLRGSTSLHGRVFVGQADFSKNPIKLEHGNQRYVTSIEGLLNCETPGEYRFCLDSGGPCFLLIDGKPAGQNGGTHRPSGKWQNSNSILLSEGYHHLRLVLAEMAAFQGVRLGWTPPNAEHPDLMPRHAFAKYVNVEPREFRQLNKNQTVFFTYRSASVGVTIQGKTIVPVELVNLSSGDGDGAWEYVWSINNCTEIRDSQPKVPLEIDQPHTVMLKAYKNGAFVESFARTIQPSAQSFTSPWFRLETIGAPNVVYVGERENLSFRVHSNITGSIALDWECVQRKRGGTKNGQPAYKVLTETAGTVSSASFGESALSIPLDTTFFGEDSEIVVRLSVTGTPVTSSLFHVIPVGSKIEHLKSSVDCLVNGDGNRAIISTHLVDQSSFRKWAIPKYLKRSMDFDKKKVLLYGSAMENTPCAGETFVSYVTRLRDRAQGTCTSFEFVKRFDEVNGILADVPRFGQVLASRDVEVVVISPGSSDVRRAIPIRDFRRSLHLMLDLIRMKNPEIRTVLVSPPPLATNVKLSNLYRTAVKELAEENRVAFVDIHTPLDGRSLLKYFKSALDDGVYLTYPNDDGQEAICDAIYGALH